MIITLEKKEFGEAVASVGKFAERKSATLPVLAGIAIVAGDDGIKLRATNLETGIDLKVKGTIKTQGVVALPATTLKEMTSSFSGSGEITLEHTGDTVIVSSSTGRSTLKTLSYDDFPTLPYPDAPTTRFTISGAVLRALIGTVGPCASPSMVRPELASVLLALESGVLKCVATDSFRLCEKKVSIPGNLPDFSLLIPAKNALDIVSTIPDEPIEMLIDEHQCAFSWKNGLLTTRLVTANYPDYKQIIPKAFVSEAVVLKKDLESAIRRTAIFADSFQKVRIGLDPAAKQVTLAARNSDVGESSEKIPASVTGESVELSFNHRYLQAPLSAITADSLTLSASGIGRPLVIKGSGDTSYLYLVMPMNQ
ncbi:DNA polymerase III subunit beta [Patescibacteria group bacterium]|nr:DNA polymerase III subunit beta [Patescibacteria group bacterium]MBU1754768.1 DNA polymerase III subunit beta [Patescibacteria group bacterium]